MFGIMTAEGPNEVIIVTSGRFNDAALAFARGKPIQLLDGPDLLDLVTSVQAGKENVSKVEPESAPARAFPQCQRCGKKMVLRTARRGSQAGGTFWGCPSYPACKGTLTA
jgi:restriction system protein